jgi:hypothetical protein
MFLFSALLCAHYICVWDSAGDSGDVDIALGVKLQHILRYRYSPIDILDAWSMHAHLKDRLLSWQVMEDLEDR